MSCETDNDNVEILIAIFNRLFSETENTRLVRGESEPVYIPAGYDGRDYHRIEFAHGFFASALHEISHWCIAGSKRREQVDYGYWYEPDGRTPEQQSEFEKVEIRPQALEWILTAACNRKFRISADNLNGGVAGGDVRKMDFEESVLDQLYRYLESGLPDRAQILMTALLAYYQPAYKIEREFFRLADL